MNMMRVERAGMYCTIQDLGRFGFQQYGVPVNGPMDEWAHRAANAIVGNEEDAAVLECTLTGPAIQFAQDTLISITGADMRVAAGGHPLPRNRAVMVRRQTSITFGGAVAGARTYLAVRGGFATEPVLGSRSTYVRSGFGGFNGRALKREDQIPVFPRAANTPPLALARTLVSSGMDIVAAAAVAAAPLQHWIAPAAATDTATDAAATGVSSGNDAEIVIRFITGPQWNAFSEHSRAAFASESFHITSQSDRMGYRLNGPILKGAKLPEMISEATCFGTVQVPPGGQPIVLMADRQSAGGYPKIAYVISADLPLLAQARPEQRVRFSRVTQQQAEKLWLQCDDAVQELRRQAKKILNLM